MSINISAYGSAIANQLLSYLLSQSPLSQAQSSNPATAPASLNAPNNTLTGASKPSLSNDVLSTIMNLQQGGSKPAKADFLDPAIQFPNTSQQPVSEPVVASGVAHNNMVHAIGKVPVANPPSTTQAASDPQDSDDTDTADASVAEDGGEIAAQSSLRI